MPVEALLSRLTKVRGRNGSWTACCPAHEDKSPSLAIKEVDGKVLVHCFGGCSVEQVVGAVGMDLTELFPPRTPDYKPQPRAKFYAADLMRVIAMEARIVAVAAYDMGKGKTLPVTDLARLRQACQRINSALEATE
jgi:DNA primase